MLRIFDDFLEGISESNDEPGMLATMARAMSALELHSFAYLAPPTASKAGTRLISTYPTSWTSHYLLQKYEHVDPVIVTARDRDEPFSWGRDVPDLEMSGPQRQLFDEASEFGIRCGFTIPLRAVGGFVAAVSFASDQRRPEFQRAIDANIQGLMLMALLFHNQVRKKLDHRRVVAGVTLTEREYECLEWSAKGKSAGEIAQILGIARRTAAFHRDNLRNKLGVRTISQAVAKFAAKDI